AHTEFRRPSRNCLHAQPVALRHGPCPFVLSESVWTGSVPFRAAIAVSFAWTALAVRSAAFQLQQVVRATARLLPYLMLAVRFQAGRSDVRAFRYRQEGNPFPCEGWLRPRRSDRWLCPAGIGP